MDLDGIQCFMSLTCKPATREHKLVKQWFAVATPEKKGKSRKEKKKMSLTCSFRDTEIVRNNDVGNSAGSKRAWTYLVTTQRLVQWLDRHLLLVSRHENIWRFWNLNDGPQVPPQCGNSSGHRKSRRTRCGLMSLYWPRKLGLLSPQAPRINLSAAFAAPDNNIFMGL